MEDRWFGNAFQIFEATDENDLEAPRVVLVELAHTHTLVLLTLDGRRNVYT